MITEETKLERERKFEKINRYFIPAYLLLGVGAAIVNAFRKDVYHFSIGLGTLLIPLALTLFYKIFHLKRVHQADFWVVLFSLLGYTCGSVLEFYLMIPNFDKVVHTLSGVLVSMLAYALFRAVKPGHAVEKKDRALAMLFVFFASMAVAGMWEICEYFVNLITGRDVQRVLATGVGDTMQDMIVCMIGTLISLPFVGRACEGKPSALTSPADAFIELNMK